MSERLYPLSLEVNGKRVEAEVPSRQTLVDFLRDTLRLTGTHVGCAFDEVSIRHGDFALVSACAQVALDADGKCLRAALGIGGASPFPHALPEAGEMLVGRRPDDKTIAEVADAVAGLIDPDGDLHATADFRRHLARVMATRVLKAAVEDAK